MNIVKFLNRIFSNSKQESLIKQLIKLPTHQLSKEDANKLVKDYTKKQTDIDLRKDGFITTSDAILDLEENKFAREILVKGEFDLSDPRIKIKSTDLDMSLEGTKEISLGKARVLRPDQIFLQDVDVNCIPQDKEIVIKLFHKEIYLVGQKEIRKGDFGKQEKGKEGIFKLQKKVFEQLSFKEFKNKILSPVESVLAILNYKQLFRGVLRKLLLFWFLLNLKNVYEEQLQIINQQKQIQLLQIEKARKLKAAIFIRQLQQ